MIKKVSFTVLMVLMAASAFAANITTSWDSPTSNEAYCDLNGVRTLECDGTTQDACQESGGTWVPRSPLTDLGGFKVKWGTVSGNYPNEVDVGLVNTKQLQNIPDDTTIYVVIDSYDTSGNLSCHSSEKVITVLPANDKVPPTPAMNVTCQQVVQIINCIGCSPEPVCQ